MNEENKMVYIENERYIRYYWQKVAKEKQIPLTVYPSFDELWKEIESYNRNTIFYIDSVLDDNVRGEIEAKKLYDMGYKNLIMATGRMPDEFVGMDWITSVQGKKPPFDDTDTLGQSK